jgi:PHD/YefM family antitoxin component YafN of YafNO toxin-antitoxin module
MQTIPAREIKRRGISAVDEQLCQGPVHVIKNDEPTYVVMSEAQYQELLEDREQAAVMRVRESLADEAAGRVNRHTNVEEMIRDLGLDE